MLYVTLYIKRNNISSISGPTLVVEVRAEREKSDNSSVTPFSLRSF